MEAVAPYPVRVEGRLEQPSRGLWLVKWLLALPHYVVLAVLWLGFVFSAFAAFVAVLFTGRYPRGLFAYNLGVLRWTWRVAFYAYNANGTDRYPPFTLADVAGYPARLDIAYPETQRRGLPLLGWWLVGIPQYAIAAMFVGGTSLGLIGILVVTAAIVLLVRGEYPRSIFDLVLGLDRWVLRVTAYAAVMTPEYPPFRLDIGEDEPGELAIGWTPGERYAGPRVLPLVVGSLVGIVGLAAAVAGAVGVGLDQWARNDAGYLMTGYKSYSSATYAIVSDSYRGGTAADLVRVRDLLGSVRIDASSDRPLFVGIARPADVAAYLAGVRRELFSSFDRDVNSSRVIGDRPPPTRPGAEAFWAAKTSGAGGRALSWTPASGSWRVVVMNRDATRGIEARVRVGARFPHLLGIAGGLLGGGLVVLTLAGSLIYISQRRRSA